ncbi:hypothetical protein AVEN_217351-1 [Araneus ventricosus]|uniref:Uncharacterized protein n=1 Tax=Araneus ventricosus TaxID=182803 RepID=A0A4Y2G8I4_ARAVE|nr:hypothetical protein AVEN_217351-1 [Araneus ventricosus]
MSYILIAFLCSATMDHILEYDPMTKLTPGSSTTLSKHASDFSLRTLDPRHLNQRGPVTRKSCKETREFGNLRRNPISNFKVETQPPDRLYPGKLGLRVA